jgi:hypothetical protein
VLDVGACLCQVHQEASYNRPGPSLIDGMPLLSRHLLRLLGGRASPGFRATGSVVPSGCGVRPWSTRARHLLEICTAGIVSLLFAVLLVHAAPSAPACVPGPPRRQETPAASHLQTGVHVYKGSLT